MQRPASRIMMDDCEPVLHASAQSGVVGGADYGSGEAPQQLPIEIDEDEFDWSGASGLHAGAAIELALEAHAGGELHASSAAMPSVEEWQFEAAPARPAPAPPTIAEAVAVPEAPSSAGALSRADNLVAILDPDGRRHDEVVKDVSVAKATLQWLRREHPEWAPSAASSRIADGAALDDLTVERFARAGASYCSGARNGVVSYEKFGGLHAQQIVNADPYPPTEDLVAWFALAMLLRVRAESARRRTLRARRGGLGRR